MSMRWLVLGGVGLAASWFVPWHELVGGHFSAHMIRHVGIVAIAAPLIALGLAGGRFDPVLRAPALFPPVQLSIVELIVVWAWHAPALHHAARHDAAIAAVEQSMFLASGLLVWIAAFGGGEHARASRRAAGLVALLLTFMHMTLLGALLALAPRLLYAHQGVADQHVGGAIMLVVAGAAYLAGGLWLARDLMRSRREEAV